MIVKREQYLRKLRAVRGKHLIKVITGIRRSGKSTLLEQFRDELLSTGVRTSQIQYCNFEKAENSDNRTWQDIHAEVLRRLTEAENYIFFDEIQNIDDWERLVDSLYARPGIDLYLTGSNAYFLSSDIATLLSGRQFEISILPFSYREYLESTSGDSRQAFMTYLRHGGMPQATEFINDESLLVEYLEGVHNTVMIKDILERDEIADAELLNRVIAYAFDNIGNLFSSKKVSDYLSSNFRKCSSQTIDKYLSAVAEAFVLYPAQRFNIRGRELLKTQRKYYLVDPGFRDVLIARGNSFDVGRSLENIVYLELRRRSSQVFIGQTAHGKEVDFVAKLRDGTLEYFQVCESLRDLTTRERELSALQDVDDNYKKTIITLDPENNNFNGIAEVNVVDWLLDN